MRPPWIEFPDHSRHCIGWRMGAGDGYIYNFLRWYHRLDEEKQKEYSAQYKPPVEWEGFYNEYFEDKGETL